jgi:hypothetical protein
VLLVQDLLLQVCPGQSSTPQQLPVTQRPAQQRCPGGQGLVASQAGQHSVPRPHPLLLIEPSAIRVRQKTALARLVLLAIVAPNKSASIRHDPLRLALVRLAPRRLAPRRFARLMLQPVQSGGVVGF